MTIPRLPVFSASWFNLQGTILVDLVYLDTLYYKQFNLVQTRQSEPA